MTPTLCHELRPLIPLFLYGELSFEEEERLESHLDSCAECRADVEREKRFLRGLNAATFEAPPELLQQCRQDLVRQIAFERPSQPFLSRILGSFSQNASFLWLARPAMAVALIAVGFVSALLVKREGEFVFSNRRPLSARVRFVEASPSGQVQIAYEEIRERTLVGDLNNETIQRLLISAAQDSNPGLRVDSIDLLKSRPDDAEVRETLVAALRNDSNAGVRLKALEGLKGAARDPEVQRVFSHALLNDQNPGVRTQVVDLLIQGVPPPRERPQMIGLLQELMSREQNGYIRMRCEKALVDMKATVDPF